MPKKPTTPFGFINFGKDGSVRCHIDLLPPIKSEQEEVVAQGFVNEAGGYLPSGVTVKMLDEFNNDFLLLGQRGDIIAEVQATEVLLRDYCTKLSDADYHAGNFQEAILQPDGTRLSVDTSARDDVIRLKVEAKLAKHYSKPKNGEFWLLLWSVSGHPIGHYYSAGTLVVSPAINRLHQWLSDKSIAPFDKVFYYELNLQPLLVWPQMG